ncbi:hypothetical protein [Candidatus Amarobacter glycogenicus]|uniref:hypothetical protein n=1 Tax=Candidatus Amarobacter glycogenicus TaxID=3140699 RepID=UPI0031CC4DB2
MGDDGLARGTGRREVDLDGILDGDAGDRLEPPGDAAAIPGRARVRNLDAFEVDPGAEDDRAARDIRDSAGRMFEAKMGPGRALTRGLVEDDDAALLGVAGLAVIGGLLAIATENDYRGETNAECRDDGRPRDAQRSASQGPFAPGRSVLRRRGNGDLRGGGANSNDALPDGLAASLAELRAGPDLGAARGAYDSLTACAAELRIAAQERAATPAVGLRFQASEPSSSGPYRPRSSAGGVQWRMTVGPSIAVRKAESSPARVVGAKTPAAMQPASAVGELGGDG